MPIVYSRKRLRAQGPRRAPSSSDNAAPPIEPSRETPRHPSTQKPRKRRRLQQLYIDAGQSTLSHTLCRRCNLLYAPGTADDALHRARHSRTTDTFSWPLRNAALLPQSSVDEGVFAVIKNDDCADANVCRRLRQLDAFVCSQLASDAVSQRDAPVHSRLKLSLRHADQYIWMILVYVVRGSVRGFVHAERVLVARCATVCDDGVTEITNSGHDHVCRRTMCGIRKIWVHQDFRNKRIASALADLCRTHLLYAGALERQHVAFTPPTTLGALFARNYFMREHNRILVYQLSEDGRPVDE